MNVDPIFFKTLLECVDKARNVYTQPADVQRHWLSVIEGTLQQGYRLLHVQATSQDIGGDKPVPPSFAQGELGQFQVDGTKSNFL